MAHLSGQEPLALRGFVLDLSDYFVGDMSSYKQGAVSALCRGYSATTRRTLNPYPANVENRVNS
jgi:hypothetical protein